MNFVTCHDGFTLNDLVSYDHKHNEENLENNRDGANDNRSWNCGVEGPTDDLGVEKLRNRQVKNFLTITLLSLGVPMITMGDEVRRTQYGNNNAYCQDNKTSWLDWTLVEKHVDLHRFLSLLIERRLLRDLEAELERRTLQQMLQAATKAWHGVKLNQPDWSDDSHSFAFGAELPNENLLFHLIANAYWEPLDFELPSVHDGSRDPWHRWIDPISIHRGTSSHGKPLHLSPATPIGPDRARWSCCTPAQSQRPHRPGRPRPGNERSSACSASGHDFGGID